MPFASAGSSGSSLHAGSLHASPIGASPGPSSQQISLTVPSWAATGPTQYNVSSLPPSDAPQLYPAQDTPPLHFHSRNVTTDSYSAIQFFDLGYPIHTNGPTASPPSNAPQVSIDPQFAIGVAQGIPPIDPAYPYGPTAGALQPGLSAHPSGQYAPIDPSEVYETLIGTSVSAGAHMKDDQGRTNILFVFGDLSVRTEGTFRLRLRLSNIGQ